MIYIEVVKDFCLNFYALRIQLSAEFLLFFIFVDLENNRNIKLGVINLRRIQANRSNLDLLDSQTHFYCQFSHKEIVISISEIYVLVSLPLGSKDRIESGIIIMHFNLDISVVIAYSVRVSQTHINPGTTQSHFTINVKPDTIVSYQCQTRIRTRKLLLPNTGHNLELSNTDTSS